MNADNRLNACAFNSISTAAACRFRESIQCFFFWSVYAIAILQSCRIIFELQSVRLPINERQIKFTFKTENAMNGSRVTWNNYDAAD
jgi:hypothetical protein